MVQSKAMVRDLLIHSLVVKGMAGVPALAMATELDADEVTATLKELQRDDLVQHVDRLDAWRPTAGAKHDHQRLLAGPLAAAHPEEARSQYQQFHDLNVRFKELCTNWQLRPSQESALTPNDHSDPVYDRAIIDELTLLDAEFAELSAHLNVCIPRVSQYRRRLAEALRALEGGDVDKFTRPLYESYHDVWMELHHDLLITLGLSRTEADT